MKQFVTVLLASLLGVLIALVVHDRAIVAPREAAREQAQAASLAHARGEADRIAQSLDASFERSVQGARQAMDDLAAGQERRGLAAEALVRASAIRTQLAEYYLTEGRWPNNGAEAGIAPSADFAGGAVAGIDVVEGGRIVVHLTDRVAANARFQLTPQASESTGFIRWRCELQGAPDIAAQLTACHE